MNYPFGEHVVYADCQPLLTVVLKPMTFAHSYLVGFLHFLIFASLIITPAIIYYIFRELETDSLASVFISLAISLLSPQFLKINAGHHGLAYTCIIPFYFCFCYDLSGVEVYGTSFTFLSSTYYCFLFIRILDWVCRYSPWLLSLFLYLLNLKKKRYWSWLWRSSFAEYYQLSFSEDLCC